MTMTTIARNIIPRATTPARARVPARSGRRARSSPNSSPPAQSTAARPHAAIRQPPIRKIGRASAITSAPALPIFLIGGWRIAAWGLAAVLWAGGELFGLLLARLPLRAGNLARAGVVALGMMFRAIVVMVILVA